MIKLHFSFACAALLSTSAVFATPATKPVAGLQSVTMHAVSAAGTGAALGNISIEQTQYGVVFTPSLTGLVPGVHGFHVHENANCGSAEKDGKPGAALAAGGHYDPDNTKTHGLPWGLGHRGESSKAGRW